MYQGGPANFFEKVYEIVKQIPPGRVTTYGAIAHCLGTKQSARMVGWALNQLKTGTNIPAHRVVNRQGLLTGQFHFGAVDTMAKRLQEEGVTIKNNQVYRLEKFLWDPMLHTYVGFNCHPSQAIQRS